MRIMKMHAVYKMAGTIFKEEVIPEQATIDSVRAMGWSSSSLLDATRCARYCATGNTIRLLIYLPILASSIRRRLALASFMVCVIVLLHLLFACLEAYKINLYRLYRKQLNADPGTKKRTSRPRLSANAKTMKLLWFETSKIYRLTGVEYFRSLVLRYEAWARLTRSERKSRTIDVESSSMAVDYSLFAERSVTSEVVHIIAAVVNTALMAVLLREFQTMAAGVVSLVTVVDYFCVLLQRYTRARVLEVVSLRQARLLSRAS